MRHLLAISWNQTNSTANHTCQAGKPWHPACGALLPIGQRYVCVSYDEYYAAATMDENSKQYTDGRFFCEGYVDYAAACDLHDNLTCNNAFAANMFDNFKRALSVYSCKSYSRIWTCNDCAAAYKRWLCSQIYKKFFIPDTTYYEEGVVAAHSLACTCEPGDIESCKRYCNGMPNDCKINDQKRWNCSREACGRSPGNCKGQIVLDLNASLTSGFYVNAKIEILSGTAQGQWALIQEYYAFQFDQDQATANGVAMFDQWHLPWGSSGSIQQPQAKDWYRIYREDAHRGYCHLSARPLVRKGQPCETGPQYGPMDPLYDPMDWKNAPLVRQQNLRRMTAFLSLTYCGEGSQCVKVDAALAPSGYLCCPKSGMITIKVQPGQSFQITYLNATNPSAPMCWVANGDSYTIAIDAIKNADATALVIKSTPTPALKAVAAAGCTENLTTIPEKVIDDCMLRTCSAVCLDVVRRCPGEFQFSCPTQADKREYDTVLCNQAVAHGADPTSRRQNVVAMSVSP
jgi:hypothetical protein